MKTAFIAPEIECQGCAAAIKKSVGALPGVSDVVVEVETKKVTIRHEASATPAAIKAALEKAGFSADAA